MLSANDKQEGGTHYAGEYQHWDFVRECLGGRYLEGNITKYVARWRKKNGVQDIRKAMHYLLKVRELFESANMAAPDPDRICGSVERFCKLNELGPEEARVMHLAANWKNSHDLFELQKTLISLESIALLKIMS